MRPEVYSKLLGSMGKQAQDPAELQAAGIPPEYLAQMQAEFGQQEQPSLVSQFAMPVGLIGAGLGVGVAGSQMQRAFPKGIRGTAASLKDKLMNLFKGGNAECFLFGFADELTKIAKKKRKMPHFTEQKRPEGVKKVYRALAHRPKKADEMRRRYGPRWKAVAARIAARQGKKGKQKQGPPYKGPLEG